jgi:hypothetical protein
MTVVRDSKVVEMAAYLASYRLPEVGECAGAVVYRYLADKSDGSKTG